MSCSPGTCCRNMMQFYYQFRLFSDCLFPRLTNLVNYALMRQSVLGSLIYCLGFVLSAIEGGLANFALCDFRKHRSNVFSIPVTWCIMNSFGRNRMLIRTAIWPYWNVCLGEFVKTAGTIDFVLSPKVLISTDWD